MGFVDPRRRIGGFACGVLCLGLSTCVIPTDESDTLSLRLVDPPRSLLVGDTVRLTAVVDGGSASASGADLRITSGDPEILLVDESGLLTAVGEGAVDLTVRLARFQSTPPVVHRLYVSRGVIIAGYRGSVTGDTILRYGETLVIEGLRLDPDSLISASIADAPAQITGFRPADPGDPDALEELRILVPVIPGGGRLVLVHRNGGSGSRVIRTVDEDIWELEDSPVEVDLAQGDFLGYYLTVDFLDDDVFRFTIPAGDWTASVSLLSGLGLSGDSPFFLSMSEQGGNRYPPWGRSHLTYACDTGGRFDGYGGAVPRNAFDVAVMPFRFDEPRTLTLSLVTESDFAFPYRLLFRQGYESELPPDDAEGNDFCDQARPLAPGTAYGFNLDTSADHDWYAISVPGAPPDFEPLRVVGEDPDNDTFESAQLVGAGDRVVGDKPSALDVDVFRVDLEAGQVLDLEMLGRILPGPLPGRSVRSLMLLDARLYGPDGEFLLLSGYARSVPALEESLQPSRTADAWIRYRAEESGTYWITVDGSSISTGEPDFGSHMYYQMDVRVVDEAQRLDIAATSTETDVDLTLLEVRDFGPNQTLLQGREDGDERLSEWVFPGQYLVLVHSRSPKAGPYELRVDLGTPPGGSR